MLTNNKNNETRLLIAKQTQLSTSYVDADDFEANLSAIQNYSTGSFNISTILPEEILREILRFLPIKDLAALHDTNKKFKMVASNMSFFKGEEKFTYGFLSKQLKSSGNRLKFYNISLEKKESLEARIARRERFSKSCDLVDLFGFYFSANILIGIAIGCIPLIYFIWKTENDSIINKILDTAFALLFGSVVGAFLGILTCCFSFPLFWMGSYIIENTCAKYFVRHTEHLKDQLTRYPYNIGLEGRMARLQEMLDSYYPEDEKLKISSNVS